MLKNDYNIIFVCLEIPKNILNEIDQNGFQFLKIDNESSFLNALLGNEIVIIDHYQLDTNYQKNIKEKGCKLVCIDDLYDKEFYADLIINHAPGVKPTFYKAQDYTKYALGLEYALLRPLFLENAKVNHKQKEALAVMVCFGGSDPKNLTSNTVDKLLKINSLQKINMVIGGANQHFTQLIEKYSSSNKIVIHHDLTEREIVTIMNTSAIAIVPASGILFEILTTDCEVISGYYIDNQKSIYEGFKKIGAFHDAEDFTKIDAVLQSVLSSKEDSKKSFIDGNSDERLLSLFKQLDT